MLSDFPITGNGQALPSLSNDATSAPLVSIPSHPLAWLQSNPDEPDPAEVLKAAQDYVRAGLSVIPISLDGDKQPDSRRLPPCRTESGHTRVSWNPYQERLANDQELDRWFNGGGAGIGIVGGRVSGGGDGCGLEIIDFDTADLATPWLAAVELRAPGLVGRLVRVQSPRPGLHVYYRSSSFGGNQKLASGAEGKENSVEKKVKKTLIETRGEGGYCLAPPSPSRCHPSNKLYRLVAGSPRLVDVPTITPAEREILLDEARKLNQWVEETPESRVTCGGDVGNRPGDDFNRRAQWADILTPHGWRHDSSVGSEGRWTRPDKDSGVSATTNYEGRELLYVFSSNTEHFRENEGYTKFEAYTRLNHDGDFSAAAAELRRQGYGGEQVVSVVAPANEPQSTAVTPAIAAAGFSGRFISSAELEDRKCELTWLIQRVLVQGQPAILGGPQKSLKTGLMIDAALSIGSGTPFLGRADFQVPNPLRVAVLSGESGDFTIQETALRIAKAKGVPLRNCDVLWGFELPQLSDSSDLKVLSAALKESGVKVLFLDPVYLCMATPDIQMNNMFHVGRVLRAIVHACEQGGATVILVHHTSKGSNLTTTALGNPLGLDDLAYSGFAQFARQWILVNHRQPYEPGTGKHSLWLKAGGSAGHDGLWGIDVEEGRSGTNFGGRKWDVQVRSAEEARKVQAEKMKERKEEVKEEKEAEALQKLFAALDQFGEGGETATAIAEAAGVDVKFARTLLRRAALAGSVQEATVKKPCGRGMKGYDGYRRVESAEMFKTMFERKGMPNVGMGAEGTSQASTEQVGRDLDQGKRWGTFTDDEDTDAFDEMEDQKV